MTFAFSDEYQTIKVYHYDENTGEYLTKSEEIIPPHTGLPADSTEVAPPDFKEGFAAVMENGAWMQVEDHRGSMVYLKATAAAIPVITLGALLDTVTLTAPTSRFDVWNPDAEAWEVDEAAKLQSDKEMALSEKNDLMAIANQQVEIWSDAVAMPDATNADRCWLAAWKKYRIQLNRVNTSQPDSVAWPDQPSEDGVSTATAEMDQADAEAAERDRIAAIDAAAALSAGDDMLDAESSAQT